MDTFNGGAFGQYCDRSHRHVLQLVDRTALGPPAVGSNPQEMAHLIGPLGSIENSSVKAFGCLLAERIQEECAALHLLQQAGASLKKLFGHKSPRLKRFSLKPKQNEGYYYSDFVVSVWSRDVNI